MTFNTFDRANTAQFTAELNAAIKAVADRHGLNVPALDVRRSRDGNFVRIMKMDVYAAGKNAFSPYENTFKALGMNDQEIAKASGTFGTDLDSMMARYGIRAKTNKKGDTLTGYNPRAPKYPFNYTSPNGTPWRITVEQAKKRFGAI